MVVEVRMVSDRVMKDFLRGCAEVYLWACSTIWKTFGGKKIFYDELK